MMQLALLTRKACPPPPQALLFLSLDLRGITAEADAFRLCPLVIRGAHGEMPYIHFLP